MMHTSLSRRSMIKLAAVAAGASLIGCANRSTDAADRPTSNDPFGGLVPGAQSYTFRRLSLDNALAAIKDLGIKQVELFPNHIAGLSPTQVKEKLEGDGSDVVANTPQEFAQAMRSEYDRWGKVIREANVHATD